MADIRTLTPTGWLEGGRLIAAAGAPAGLTVGRRYWPLALGYNATNDTVYVLVADDNGALKAFPASTFQFIVDNLAP